MKALGNISDYRVVLASGSPRRRELLAMLGVEFEVSPIKGLEETYPSTLPAEEVAVFLSRLKAEAVLPTLSDNELVITADTVVICDGDVLGKPHDEAEARAMLRRLSGRTHTVVTGVSVTTSKGIITRSASTEVEFAPLREEEIDEYVECYRPLDKAGAYGIQEWIGAAGIKGIRGSFYNVMGLPLHVLYTMLRSI